MTDLVVKTNKFVSAVQSLSLFEARLLQLAIIDAREKGEGLSLDKPLTITAERYAEAFDINKKNAYEMLKKAEESLFNRRFQFLDEEENEDVKTRWIVEARYPKNKGYIKITLSPVVVRHITRIDGKLEFFTKYLLKNTIKFKSVYSIRLYELVCMWKNEPKKKPYFELNTFRGQLGVEDNQYKAMSDFKKYVLDKAVKEINTNSDLKIDYKQVKDGRLIIGFEFSIKQKNVAKSKKIIEHKDQNTPDLFAPIQMTEKQLLSFSTKLAQMHELEKYAVGELNDYNKLAEWIRCDILKPERAEFYRPLLKKLGFVEK